MPLFLLQLLLLVTRPKLEIYRLKCQKKYAFSSASASISAGQGKPMLRIQTLLQNRQQQLLLLLLLKLELYWLKCRKEYALSSASARIFLGERELKLRIQSLQ